MARVSIRFEGENLDARRAAQGVEKDLEAVSRQAVQTRASLSNVWGDKAGIAGFSKAVDGLNVSLGNTTHQTKLFSGSLGLIKWPAIYTGASLAAQGVGALGAGMVALTAAIAPAAGVLGALPAALSTAAQAMGTFKLATRGLKEGIEGDAEALAKLSPAARAFAGIVKDSVLPAFERLSRVASQRLFGPLLDEIGPLMDAHLPRLQRIVGETATALGRIGEKLAQQLRSPEWGKALDELGAMNVRVIENLGNAALKALPGIRDLTLAFAPLVEWVSRGAEVFGKWLSASVAANKANGDLDRSVARVKETLSSLGAILGNLAKGFWEIGKAAAPLGREILRDLEKVTAQFVSWTRSMEGKATLKQYFEDAKAPLYEVGRLVRDVVGAFFRISTDEGFTNLIRQLRTELLPMLEQVVRTTTEKFGPALIEMSVAVGKLFLTLAGSSGPLVTFVKGLGDIADKIREIITTVPGLDRFVVTLAGVVGVMKVLTFTAAITGIRSMAASLGLVGPAASGAAASVGVSSAAMSRSLAGVSASAATTSLALRGVSTSAAVASVASIGSAGRLTAALGGTRLAALRVGAAFGPWGIAIGTAVSLAIPYLDDLGRAIDRVAKKLPGGDYSGADLGRDVLKLAGKAADKLGAPDERTGTTTVTPSPGAARHPDSAGGARGVGGVSQGQPTAVERLAQASDIVAIGKILQSMGLGVGEHPAFGGVAPVHTESSYHYSGQAIDVTGPESTLDMAAAALSKNPNVIELIWRAKGHYNHMHVAAGAATSSGTYYNVGGSSTGEAGAGTGSGAVSAPAKSTPPPPPSQREIAAVASPISAAIRGIAGGLDKDIPELRARILPQLKALMADLANGVNTDAALAKIKAEGEKLKAGLRRMIEVDAIRDSLDAATRKLRELFKAGFIDEVVFRQQEQAVKKLRQLIAGAMKDGWVSPAEQAKIRDAWAGVNEVIRNAVGEMTESQIKLQILGREFRKLWADGILSADDAAKIRASAGQIKGAVAEAISGAAEAVEQGYAKFDTAWQTFRSQIEAAFREQVVGKFQLTIDFASVYEQTAQTAARLREALAALSKALEGQLSSDEQAIATALERVRRANEAYTAAIISQDRERIKAAIDERLAANAALKALETQGLSERAQAILAAGREVVAAEQEIGAQQVAEQKRIWEETKAAALAGVLAVVDEVGGKLRDGKVTWAQAVQEIGVALTAAGMDAGSAADLLGQNVSSAMGKAAAAIETAVGLLVTAINNLVRVMEGSVGKARGQVAEAEALYQRLRKIGGATDAEAMRIANAAASAGVASSPAPAASSSSSPSASTSSGSTSSPSASAQASPEPEPQPSGGGGGGRTVAMAEGGIVERPFAGYATLAERFREAVIPMPPWMDARVRQLLEALARGGWRSPIGFPRFPGIPGFPHVPGSGGESNDSDDDEGVLKPGWGGPEHAWRGSRAPSPVAPPPRFVVPSEPGVGWPPFARRRPGDVGPGRPIYVINMPVTVKPEVLTSDRELGATLTRIVLPPLRQELHRIGLNEATDGMIQPFGGR